MKKSKDWILGISLMFMAAACKPQTSPKGESEEEVTDASETTGKYDPSKETTLTADSSNGAISGSGVTVPVGALAVDAKISIAESTEIASTAQASNLGLDASNSLTPSSTAVIVSSTANSNLAVPMTIALPVSSTSGLLLNSGSLNPLTVVVYIVKNYATNKNELGIIPYKDLSLKDGKVLFKTKYFGSYQVALTKVAVPSAIKVESKIAPISKVEAEAIKADSLAKARIVTLTFNTATREIKASGEVDHDEAYGCGFMFDKNKNEATAKKFHSKNRTFSQIVDASVEGTYHLKIRCQTISGISVESGWDKSVAITKGENQDSTVVAITGGNFSYNQSNQTLYYYAPSSAVKGCEMHAFLNSTTLGVGNYGDISSSLELTVNIAFTHSSHINQNWQAKVVCNMSDGKKGESPLFQFFTSPNTQNTTAQNKAQAYTGSLSSTKNANLRPSVNYLLHEESAFNFSFNYTASPDITSVVCSHPSTPNVNFCPTASACAGNTCTNASSLFNKSYFDVSFTIKLTFSDQSFRNYSVNFTTSEYSYINFLTCDITVTSNQNFSDLSPSAGDVICLSKNNINDPLPFITIDQKTILPDNITFYSVLPHTTPLPPKGIFLESGSTITTPEPFLEISSGRAKFIGIGIHVGELDNDYNPVIQNIGEIELLGSELVDYNTLMSARTVLKIKNGNTKIIKSGIYTTSSNALWIEGSPNSNITTTNPDAITSGLVIKDSEIIGGHFTPLIKVSNSSTHGAKAKIINNYIETNDYPAITLYDASTSFYTLEIAANHFKQFASNTNIGEKKVLMKVDADNVMANTLYLRHNKFESYEGAIVTNGNNTKMYMRNNLFSTRYYNNADSVYGKKYHLNMVGDSVDNVFAFDPSKIDFECRVSAGSSFPMYALLYSSVSSFMSKSTVLNATDQHDNTETTSAVLKTDGSIPMCDQFNTRYNDFLSYKSAYMTNQ